MILNYIFLFQCSAKKYHGSFYSELVKISRTTLTVDELQYNDDKSLNKKREKNNEISILFSVILKIFPFC